MAMKNRDTELGTRETRYRRVTKLFYVKSPVSCLESAGPQRACPEWRYFVPIVAFSIGSYFSEIQRTGVRSLFLFSLSMGCELWTVIKCFNYWTLKNWPSKAREQTLSAPSLSTLLSFASFFRPHARPYSAGSGSSSLGPITFLTSISW